MCDAEREEKLAFVAKVVKRLGIGEVRDTILDYTMTGYVDMGHGDLLDAVQSLLTNGCKAMDQMTEEDIANELDLQELRELFTDE